MQSEVVIEEEVVTLGIDTLKTPRYLLRPTNDKVVAELKRSIESTGILQPIVVRRDGTAYEVVFGNHRLEACRRLGISQIRAIVKPFNDEEAFLAQVSENLIRNTYIDPVEEAKGYKMLVSKGWTINAIGRRVGKCDSYISERLGVLDNLSDRVRSHVSHGLLTPSHAELLSRIRDHDLQNYFAELVRKRRLSVRSLENILKRTPSPTRIKVESISNEYVVKIPEQFALAMGLKISHELFIYMQGQKLIIENTNFSLEHSGRPVVNHHDDNHVRMNVESYSPDSACSEEESAAPVHNVSSMSLPSRISRK
jgi:ParB family chromosome partitioning protein